jgi:hypothetical protein
LRALSCNANPFGVLGLTVLSDVLVIADAVIEERFFLLRSMSPLMARNGHAAMSAVRSLPGVNRTWPDTPDSVEIDPERKSLFAKSYRLAVATVGAAWLSPISATTTPTT